VQLKVVLSFGWQQGGIGAYLRQPQAGCSFASGLPAAEGEFERGGRACFKVHFATHRTATVRQYGWPMAGCSADQSATALAGLFSHHLLSRVHNR